MIGWSSKLGVGALEQVASISLLMIIISSKMDRSGALLCAVSKYFSDQNISNQLSRFTTLRPGRLKFNQVLSIYLFCGPQPPQVPTTITTTGTLAHIQTGPLSVRVLLRQLSYD